MKYLALICVLSFFSCSRVGSPDGVNNHQPDQNDDIFPTISVEKPTDNQQFVSGDTLFIKGQFLDNKKLYNAWIRVHDDASGNLIKQQYFETHVSPTIAFDIYHITSVTLSSNYTISFEVEDHGFNKSFRTVKVKVNPLPAVRVSIRIPSCLLYKPL